MARPDRRGRDRRLGARADARARRRLARGDALLSPSVTRRVIEEFARLPAPSPDPPAALEALTAREIEELRLLANGLSYPEIARTLVLSGTTVKTRVNHVLMIPVRLRQLAADSSGRRRRGVLRLAPPVPAATPRSRRPRAGTSPSRGPRSRPRVAFETSSGAPSVGKTAKRLTSPRRVCSSREPSAG
jgi:DNA-binding CsgD family transcriptional regulator